MILSEHGKIFNLDLQNYLNESDSLSLSSFKFLENNNVLVEFYLNDKTDLTTITYNNNITQSINKPDYLGNNNPMELSEEIPRNY